MKSPVSTSVNSLREAPRTFGREAEATAGESGRVASCLPTREQIAARAYEIYERNGRQEGRRDADWRQAEFELSAPLGPERSLSPHANDGRLTAEYRG